MNDHHDPAGTIAQDGTVTCLICHGPSTSHQRLELATGQRIPCPWVDDDDLPDVWASRWQYAAHVFVSLPDADQVAILDDYGMSAFDPAFLTAFTENMDARNNGTVTFTDTLEGVVVDDEAL